MDFIATKCWLCKQPPKLQKIAHSGHPDWNRANVLRCKLETNQMPFILQRVAKLLCKGRDGGACKFSIVLADGTTGNKGCQDPVLRLQFTTPAL
jgi:hypothetical protein